ncbi:RNA polymerase B [Entomophthora muscae]|uniref:RNA polymerase B n=1 Tax=Entomophthora muscae TaxID=34485 RepID=A0ACC2UCT0_9FUNG|nr:RNA polymerase B [Entomophthora muscae]
MLLEAQLESKTGDKGFTEYEFFHVPSFSSQLFSSFEKTLAYCKRFNRITRYDTVREVRRILTRSTMQPFEIAQVASLSCEDADEARALVPRYFFKHFFLFRKAGIEY